MTILYIYFLKSNGKYYLHIFYKDNINFFIKSKLATKLEVKFKNLIAIYIKKFYYL